MTIEQIASAECESLHERLFGFPLAHEGIRHDYVRVARQRLASEEEVALSTRMVTEDLNPAALEYYWRLRRGRNALTRRFEVLAALCEATPGYAESFINHTAGRLRAFLRLGLLPLKCAHMVVVGAWQSHRYGIRL